MQTPSNITQQNSRVCDRVHLASSLLSITPSKVPCEPLRGASHSGPVAAIWAPVTSRYSGLCHVSQSGRGNLSRREKAPTDEKKHTRKTPDVLSEKPK